MALGPYCARFLMLMAIPFNNNSASFEKFHQVRLVFGCVEIISW